MASARDGAGTAPTKLCVIIASNTDATRLMEQLVEHGLPATKIGSTGGFLRRGNVTVLSGVPADAVDRVMEIVRRECHARTELMPVQMLPMIGGEAGMHAEPVEVRVGGAIMFVVGVERFLRT